jgi:zinc transport system ATP-binding protein
VSSGEAREALVSCTDLVVGHRGKALLPPISLTLRRGEIWAVIGRNGSGKTSLMKTLLALHSPVSGHVNHERARVRLAYLAQRQAYDDFYPLLARDVVGMGLERERSFWRRPTRDRPERIERALGRCGAGDLALKPFRQLSEGQKQRVLFARVAVGEPDMALLDEPTSAMDMVAERESFELIARLAAELSLCVVIVSHYLGVVHKFADRALLLDREQFSVVQGTPAEVLAHDSFRARYGAAVEGAVI